MKHLPFFLLMCMTILSACSNKDNSIYDRGSFTFPGGRTKALVFSYDDGVESDKKLVDLFNKHNLKGTFNLNSGKLGTSFDYSEERFGRKARYIPTEEVSQIFKGHEVAAHTVNHPHLFGQPEDLIFKETQNDIDALEKLVDYEVVSFAYPFGDANDAIAAILNRTKLTNARTVKNTRTFDLPEDFLQWHPTCHHNSAYKYIKQFNKPQKKPSVFYIWGHSWELEGNDDNNNWDYMEDLCNRLSGKSDVWYTTLGELSEYLNAIKLLEVHGSNVTNTSQMTVYLITGDKIKKLTPGDECKLQ